MHEHSATQLLNFIREQYGSKFAEYYDGDPDLIPDFNLPCIVVQKNSDQTENGPTGLQRVTEELLVKVILNKADDWTGGVDPTQLTEKRIRDMVEGRDAVTGRYRDDTLKHALMTRFTYEGAAIDQGMRFELGVNPRDLTAGSELITEEGHLTLTISYLVPNPINA